MDHDAWVKAVFDVDPADYGAPRTTAANEDGASGLGAKANVAPAPDPKAKQVKDTSDKVLSMSDGDLKKLSSDDKAQMVRDLFAAGKPSGDARKAQIKIYKDMDLDPAFKKREQERGDRMAKALAADKDVKDAHDHWDKQTVDRKVAALKKIVAAQCKEYGFPVPEIVTFDKPVESLPGGKRVIEQGFFLASDGKLHLNTNAAAAFNDFESIVNTVLHENGHNYQSRLVKNLHDGKIKKGDPDYEQAQMFDVNDSDDAYIQPSEDFDAYVGQPEERHSRTIGADMTRKINTALTTKTK